MVAPQPPQDTVTALGSTEMGTGDSKGLQRLETTCSSGQTERNFVIIYVFVPVKQTAKELLTVRWALCAEPPINLLFVKCGNDRGLFHYREEIFQVELRQHPTLSHILEFWLICIAVVVL